MQLNDATDGALNADMMERLGVPFECAHLIGWHNVADFARHLDQASCVWRAQFPEEANYSSALHANAALADIFDIIAAFAANFARAHGNGRAKTPKPYPRPWISDRDERHIGRDPIPVADFDDWYYGGGE